MLMVVVPLAVSVLQVSAAVAMLFRFWNSNVVAVAVNVLAWSVAPKLVTLTPNTPVFATMMAFVLVVAVEIFTWPPLTVTPPVNVLGPVKLQVPDPEKTRYVVIVLLVSTTLPEIIPLPAPCRVKPRFGLTLFLIVPPSTSVSASDWMFT